MPLRHVPMTTLRRVLTVAAVVLAVLAPPAAAKVQWGKDREAGPRHSSPFLSRIPTQRFEASLQGMRKLSVHLAAEPHTPVVTGSLLRANSVAASGQALR
jgi:hypothetical protein